jgi:signal transduction histidine kinase
LPGWQKITGILLILPTAIWTFFGSNLIAFDSNVCEALEHESITLYPYFVEGIFLIAILTLAITQYRKTSNPTLKKEIILATVGVGLFLGFFFFATLGVNFLVNYSIIDFAYNFEIYGLFGMPILLVYLGFLIVRYKAFDLRIFSVQALAVATITIVAAQYAFLNSLATTILNTANLVLVSIVSIYLIKNVRKEIALRKKTEQLGADLELANKRQIETLRFITHEVKGYLTDSSAAFDAILTETFGPVSADMKSMVGEALEKDQRAVTEIKDFLRIADFKTGRVKYEMKPFDFAKELRATLPTLEEAVKAKGLSLTCTIAPAEYTITGDAEQLLTHVVDNLVRNSINYTPQGGIAVALSRGTGTIKISVTDTGIGLTDDDKKVLFTEGGYGTESRSVNPHSTGYGLFIAKKIVEAHGGTITAESDGRGTGSTFLVELPVSPPPSLAPSPTSVATTAHV